MTQLIHWEPWQLAIQWGLILLVWGAILWTKYGKRAK